jgi:DNA invertase Pin-like site-specific DNA recombinase
MDGKLIGYARVSSAGQSLDVQREQLTAAGCTKIFEEKRSGRRAADRPALADALGYVREGDTLAVTRLDRLARSAMDLKLILAQLTAKGVGFRALQQGAFDTHTATGKLVLGILGEIAEFETDLRRERQAEGIAKAKAEGVYKGRAPTLPREAIAAALAAGERPHAVAKRLGVARSSIYRVRDEGAAR